MVLQRWQSVFLLLAAIAMAVFTFMPVMGLATDNGVVTLSALGCDQEGVSSMVLLVLDCLSVILLLVTIFKYHDLKLQQRLCKVNILLLVAIIAFIVVMWLMQRGQAIAVLKPWIVLPFVALFFTMWASGRIKADRKLLSDSERIR